MRRRAKIVGTLGGETDVEIHRFDDVAYFVAGLSYSRLAPTKSGLRFGLGFL